MAHRWTERRQNSDVGLPAASDQRRCEHRSIVLTTNLAFPDGHTVFPNASCALALIDRLTHHAGLAPIEGERYRRREAALTLAYTMAHT